MSTVEPVGETVNSYQKTKRINSIMKALNADEVEVLRKSPFGKLIATAEKPSYSGSFGQYIITRKLNVRKKHEIWFLFAGKPIRFSLREFAIVIGLPCGKYPKKKRKRNSIKEAPYYVELFENLDPPTVDSITRMLKKKTVVEKEIRIKYACLALLSFVLFPTSHHPKIIRAHAEMIRDLGEFFAYPWDRAAFEMVMASIKDREPVALAQCTIAVKGFFHSLQLVMVEAVPSLTEEIDVNDSSESFASDSDGDNGEVGDRGGEICGKTGAT